MRARASCSVPPKSTSATRSRRARWALASEAAARTAASSVPLAPSRASSNVSSSSTTSLACSGWRSVTYSAPRLAVARQFTRRTRSPTAKRRISANSIPSPGARATCAPRNGWVRSGATSSRRRCSRGNARTVTRRSSRRFHTATPNGSRARTTSGPSAVGPPALRTRHEPDLGFRSGRQAQQHSASRLQHELTAREKRELDFDRGAGVVVQRDRDTDLLSLEQPGALWFDRGHQPWLARQDQGDTDEHHERSAEHHELRSPTREATHHAKPGQREQPRHSR